MDTWLMLVAAVLLVLLNGMFVAAEFAFVKARGTKLELMAQSGHKRAQAALFGINNLDAYLSVCQLGITLASLGLGWLGEPAVAALLRPVFAFFGIESPALAQTLSVVVGFSIITFAHVTFGELAPKTISIRSAETTALLLAWPMRVFYFLFLPAVELLNWSARLTLKAVGASSWHSDTGHSTEELKMLIAESKEGGHLDEAEERFVNNIFNLDKRFARDIMVHRTRVESLSAEDSVDVAISLVRRKGHTRFPVYEGDKDNVQGFIHAKDLLKADLAAPVRGFLRPALYVYDHLPIDDVLELMQGRHQQFGLVWDEYGSWQGLITMEDIIEAIVGNIQDEFDHEEPEIRALADGGFAVASTISLDEIKGRLGLDLGPDAEEHYRPLAALLVEKFGELPKEGDSIELYGRLFTVTRIDNHTIARVHIAPAAGSGAA